MSADTPLRRLSVLMATAFVDMMGYALIFPLLPFYATRFGADPFTVGALMATFALAQMLVAPLWGRLSDRVGRRPVILGALLISAVSFVTFAFAESVLVLFACRLLQGVGGGTTGVLSAYVSDAVGPEERAKGLGWITAATSAGVMIGPAIGSFAIRWGTAAPGLIAAVICVLNILFAWRWLPESASSEPAGQDTEKPRQRQPLRREILGVLRRPTAKISALIWVYAAGMMAFFAMNAVTALYLGAHFGITEESIGWFYFAVGAVSVVVRALVLGVVVKRFGEVRVLRLGAVTLGLAMIMMPLAADIWQFLAMALFVPVGTAFLFPSTTSLISRYADPREVGQTLGVQQAFGGTSRLLGPVWAGAVFQQIGHPMPYWLAGALVLATALFSLRLHPGEAPRHGAADESPTAVG